MAVVCAQDISRRCWRWREWGDRPQFESFQNRLSSFNMVQEYLTIRCKPELINGPLRVFYGEQVREHRLRQNHLKGHLINYNTL